MAWVERALQPVDIVSSPYQVKKHPLPSLCPPWASLLSPLCHPLATTCAILLPPLYHPFTTSVPPLCRPFTILCQRSAQCSQWQLEEGIRVVQEGARNQSRRSRRPPSPLLCPHGPRLLHGPAALPVSPWFVQRTCAGEGTQDQSIPATQVGSEASLFSPAGSRRGMWPRPRALAMGTTRPCYQLDADRARLALSSDQSDADMTPP